MRPHQEQELMRLCRSKAWGAVLERCQSHPSEAEPSEGAITGHSSTALSVAVRAGAPNRVIEFLLRANWDQIGVTHPLRGSILHDALKHRVEDDVLHYLVQAAIQYEKLSGRHDHGESSPFLLLGHKDELGRNALHYMIDRVVRALERGDRSRSYWNSFLLLVQAYPHAVETMDADGSTPLVTLLLTPRFPLDSVGKELEREVFRLVQLLVAICPSAVAVSRRLPRPWHYQRQTQVNFTSLVQGEGVPSPLSCALLHGRSIDTIKVLLDANRKLGFAPCRTIVTHNREVPLHVAVTMRAPIDLISRLLQDESEVLDVADIHGLIPLDWIWIRHVLEWFSSPSDALSPVMVSRRRYLGNHFLEWQSRVSNQYLGLDTTDLEQSPNPQVRQWTRRLKEDLLSRIATVLPVMAAQVHKNSVRLNNAETGTEFDHEHLQGSSPSWTLLHAACYVHCPLAMVALALQASSSDVLRTRDTLHGRLPLHYAASRGGGYMASFPVGVSCSPQSVQEMSPTKLVLSWFPQACQVRDAYGQLPLHIAIDAGKETRRRQELDESNSMMWEHRQDSFDVGNNFDDDVDLLLFHYPDGLEEIDGITNLFPFMQAAEGSGASVNTIYNLLRRNPTLLWKS